MRRRDLRPLLEPLECRRLLSQALAGAADESSQRLAAASTLPARQMENLDRGIVAVRASSTRAYVSWRLLGVDPANLGFNLYRSANGGAAVKLNSSVLIAGTNFTDTTANFSASNAYTVRAVVNGVEQPASKPFVLAANTPVRQFLNVPLQIPAGGTTPDGVSYTYSANDASVADLDGDGEYEIILKWDPSNAKDNSQSGYTGHVYVDAYKLNGTRLWRIDLGINIRAGAHYTQFIAYDLDGDGKAEVAMKTAPGTKDGLGNNVILPGDDPSADYRNSGGYILGGPEYLTIFNGQSGAAMATTNFLVARGNVSSWGDGYGNRVDRFLAGVAYLDGVRPSLIMGRGYYERTTVSAWNWRDGQLTQAWARPFDTEDATPDPAYAGQGAHSLSIADVDGDGKDEIIYGAMTLDHDGRGLYSTGFGHGDALHVSDMIPSRPGLEVFQVHESAAAHQGNGGTLRDAATGELIFGIPGSGDVGRGVAFDIDPRYAGYEIWTIADSGLYNVDGTRIQDRGNAFLNFGIWWDADLLRELLDGTTIADWRISNGVGGRVNLVYAPAGVSSNNGTKNTPALSGDILGDWREEVIWRASDSSALQIWTTTIPTSHRIYTLMHDPVYRMSIAWQNAAYNQPPHTGFFLGDGMAAPPAPNIYLAGVGPSAPTVSVAAAATPNPVYAGSTNLSVLGWDDGGEAALSYTWSVPGEPPAPVSFSVNSSNAAKNTTAAFAAEGTYQLRVTITDADGLSTTSSTVVTVNDDVVWYPMDASGGTMLADSSGNNKPASLSGSYSFVAGVRGNAVKFSGGHATLPAGIVSDLNDFTIATWVRPDTLNTWSRVFDFGSGTNSYMFLTPAAATTLRPRFAISTGGYTNEQSIDAPVTIPANAWTHLTVTLAGSTLTLYVNGTAVATKGNVTLRPSSLGATTQNYLGESQFVADPMFLGTLDDFRIFGRALAPAEVRGLAGGTVSGWAFHDTNGDGVAGGGAGEPPLTGVTVYLDANGNAALDDHEQSTTAGASGTYTFDYVPAGGYTVRTIAPDEFAPSSTTPAVVTVSSGAAISGVDLPHARILYTGTGAADHYVLRKNAAGRFEILIGGTLAYTVFAGVPSLAFDLGEGDDSLTVDLVNGAPMPGGGITLDGGSGAADELHIVGTAAAGAAQTVAFNAADVAFDGLPGSISHTGLEAATFDGNGGWDQLTVSGGGPAVRLRDAQQLALLAIGAGGLVTTPAGGAATLALRRLEIAGGGRLDLADNNLIMDYDADGGGTSPLADIHAWVAAGRNGGMWDGSGGIVTSMAAASTGSTTLAVAEAAAVFGLSDGQTQTWSGQTTIDATSVVVKYTWAGDANLDGLVSGDDYTAIDFAIATPGASGYFNGDFNYDGIISGDDYTVLDFNLAAQGAAFSSAAGGASSGGDASASAATPMSASPADGLLSAPVEEEKEQMRALGLIAGGALL